MTLGNFFKCRLIRLHPMVIMGMFIGTVFYFFGSKAILAYACLKLYDNPVRQWLQKRFLTKTVKQ